MDAQTRRRERRAEKQAQWKAANPLLVGVSAKPVIAALEYDDDEPIGGVTHWMPLPEPPRLKEL